MDDKSLMTFIMEREETFGEHATAKEKWLILNKLMISLKSNIGPMPTILDAGGMMVTADIIKKLFCDSVVYHMNMNIKRDIRGDNNGVQHINVNLEADNFRKQFDEPCDLIFFMDVIEHLHDPDKALRNLNSVLKKGGYLIISTVNLASIYNRFFLLMGYSLHNYNVSLWYKTGNPFIKDMSGERHGDHKSVFTVKQLAELLEEVYGLKVLNVKSYSYYEPDWLSYREEASVDKIRRNSRIYLGHNWIRGLVSRILPTTLAEGFLVIAQK